MAGWGRDFSGRDALVVAVLATFATGVLAWVSHEAFPRDGFLFFYMPVIGAVAYLGGPWPGAAAAAVGLVTARFFIIPPAYTFTVSAETLPILALFALIAALVVDGARRLRDAEMASHRLALVVESAEDAIFSKSLDGVIETWNPAAERLYGYTGAEAAGRSVSMLIPSDRPNEIPRIMARLRRGEHVEYFETVRVRKDGARIDVSVSFSPVTDAAGRIVGVSVIARDITARKQAEARDREQQELDRVLNAVAAAIGGQTDLQQMLTVLLDHLHPIVGFTGGSIILRENDGLVLRAAVGPFTARALGQRLPRGVGRVWQVIDRGEPFLSGDLLADGLAPTTPLRSYLAVPLLQSGRPFGVLEIDSTEPRAFEAVNLTFMQRVASVMSGSVEVALRYTAEAQARADADAARRAERDARQAAERVTERIERLQGITAALSEALTPEQVAAVAVDQGVRAIGAQAGALSLVAPDGLLDLIRAIGYPEDLIRRWQRYSADRYGVIADAMRTGRLAWYASSADLHADHPEHEPLPKFLADGGRAAVPVILGDRVIGVLYLNFQERRVFETSDINFMLTLGRQCAQAFERARLYAQEHQVAATLQHALLPTAFPEIPGVRIDAVYKAAGPETEVGGDWYDAFALPGGRLVLTVGDVAGRGLDAAVLMGEVRHAIRATALAGHDPAKVLQVANSVVRGDARRMVTAVVAILDPITLQCTYAAAGHPAPVLATTRNGVDVLEQGTFPLGVRDGLPAEVESLRLPPEALLVLYTDGLVEFDRDVAGGEAALQAAVAEQYRRRLDHPAQAILEQVLSGHPARDDIAILTVNLEGSQPSRGRS